MTAPTDDLTPAPQQADKTRRKRLTVIVVSDTEGARKTWEDEIAAIKALAAQDFDEPFALMIVEPVSQKGEPVPAAVRQPIEDFTIHYAPTEKSAGLKDAGIARCETEWLVVLDADCAPHPNWLRLMMAAADAHPEYAAYSGRTFYGDETSLLRVLNILDRSGEDFGKDGPSLVVQNNAALFKTEIIKQFPYRDMPSPFCSPGPRGWAMMNKGHKFYYVHEALVRHELDDKFIGDFRKHMGFMKIFTRQNGNLGAVFMALGSSLKHDFTNIVTKHRRYLRTGDWPLLWWMYVRVRLPEIAGIADFMTGKGRPQNTHFR